MVDGTGHVRRLPGHGRRRDQFACVDGPEFDGHEVDFEELADRLTTYRSFEQAALAARRDEEAKGACATTEVKA